MGSRSSSIFTIKGRVQGVYYRVSIQRAAQQAGFCGYIKNLANGDVEAGVYCKEENLNKFINILKKGSQNSQVKHIEKKESTQKFSSGFEIRY